MKMVKNDNFQETQCAKIEKAFVEILLVLASNFVKYLHELRIRSNLVHLVGWLARVAVRFVARPILFQALLSLLRVHALLRRFSGRRRGVRVAGRRRGVRAVFDDDGKRGRLGCLPRGCLLELLNNFF